ncbi:predicted protein [Chaetoceros tenuissimus]|uniref:Uncharacterized protein n=1 Tax=Chaetoceros tenuissimus TaxID=426638 RepID=A0AAD3HDE4_9STRA|nr:predicted protein [Chaetoceros tenuissimus]
MSSSQKKSKKRRSESGQQNGSKRMKLRRNPGRTSRDTKSYDTHESVIESAPSSPFSTFNDENKNDNEFQFASKSIAPSSLATKNSNSENEFEFASPSSASPVNGVTSSHSKQVLKDITNTTDTNVPHEHLDSNIDGNPSILLTPVQLTNNSALPQGCPEKIKNKIDWDIRNEGLKRKPVSNEPKHWDELMEGGHLDGGQLNWGPNKKDMEHFGNKLVEIGALNTLAGDGLSIRQDDLVLNGNVVHKKTFEEMCDLDQKTQQLLRDQFENFDTIVEEIYDYNGNKIMLSFKIARHKAIVGKAGCITIHWDSLSKMFPWDLRAIFTIGNWAKLFGFTDSKRQEDPFYVKLFKHGDFIVMDRKASGSEKIEDGTHLHHSATLLPRPEECEEEELYLYSIVMDMRPLKSNKGTFWPSAHDFVQWLIEKGFAQSG